MDPTQEPTSEPTPEPTQETSYKKVVETTENVGTDGKNNHKIVTEQTETTETQ